MADELIHEQAAAYALDALDEHERERFEEHLTHCAHCRDLLAEFSATAAALAFAAPSAQPPPALRGRILDAARTERPNVVPLRPRWAVPALAAAVVASAAAVAFGIWAATLHSRVGNVTALHAVGLRGAAGSLVVGSGGRATLVVTGLERPPAGKRFEAWVIRDNVPEPAGMFAGSAGTTVFSLTRDVAPGAVVAVTVERASGVSRPTTKPVLVSARI